MTGPEGRSASSAPTPEGRSASSAPAPEGRSASSAPTPEGRSASSAPTWDLEVRPHLTPYFAYGAAFLIAAAHIAVGFLLKIGSSGVIFQTSDQVAIGLLGVIIGCLVLLFARPRLRVGAAGVAVRNMLGYKVIPWSDVVDVSFPIGARWARVDLPDYEYVPVMAIQAVDKDRAVAAMDSVRQLIVRYRPDVSPRSTTS